MNASKQTKQRLEYTRNMCKKMGIQVSVSILLSGIKEPVVGELALSMFKDDDMNSLNMIHVTGTKGKGSTSAFLESILRHSGYKTGLFRLFLSTFSSWVLVVVVIFFL